MTDEQKIDLIVNELRSHSEKYAEWIFNNAVYGFVSTLESEELDEVLAWIKPESEAK
jgi:hypothetical protein